MKNVFLGFFVMTMTSLAQAQVSCHNLFTDELQIEAKAIVESLMVKEIELIAGSAAPGDRRYSPRDFSKITDLVLPVFSQATSAKTRQLLLKTLGLHPNSHSLLNSHSQQNFVFNLIQELNRSATISDLLNKIVQLKNSGELASIVSIRQPGNKVSLQVSQEWLASWKALTPHLSETRKIVPPYIGRVMDLMAPYLGLTTPERIEILKRAYPEMSVNGFPVAIEIPSIYSLKIFQTLSMKGLDINLLLERIAEIHQEIVLRTGEVGYHVPTKPLSQATQVEQSRKWLAKKDDVIQKVGGDLKRNFSGPDLKLFQDLVVEELGLGSAERKQFYNSTQQTIRNAINNSVPSDSQMTTPEHYAFLVVQQLNRTQQLDVLINEISNSHQLKLGND